MTSVSFFFCVCCFLYGWPTDLIVFQSVQWMHVLVRYVGRLLLDILSLQIDARIWINCEISFYRQPFVYCSTSAGWAWELPLFREASNGLFQQQQQKIYRFSSRQRPACTASRIIGQACFCVFLFFIGFR